MSVANILSWYYQADGVPFLCSFHKMHCSLRSSRHRSHRHVSHRSAVLHHMSTSSPTKDSFRHFRCWSSSPYSDPTSPVPQSRTRSVSNPRPRAECMSYHSLRKEAMERDKPDKRKAWISRPQGYHLDRTSRQRHGAFFFCPTAALEKRYLWSLRGDHPSP